MQPPPPLEFFQNDNFRAKIHVNIRAKPRQNHLIFRQALDKIFGQETSDHPQTILVPYAYVHVYKETRRENMTCEWFVRRCYYHSAVCLTEYIHG